MRIRTEFIYPPIPMRCFDWSAVDDDTYDGAEDSGTRGQIGRGATEAEAIADLMEILSEDRVMTSEVLSTETNERNVAPGIWLMCSEMVIENEIKHKEVRQKDIAMTMALSLRSEAAGASKPDWKRIKEQAWKLARGGSSNEGE